MDYSLGNQRTMGADGQTPVSPSATAGHTGTGGASVCLPGDANDRSLGDRRTMPGSSGASAAGLSMGDDRTMRPGVAGPAGRRFSAGDLILGRYRVTGELGQGGMGVVYRCSDEVTGVDVALKALPPDVARDSGELEEVRANFRLVERLHHPNIANVKTLERDPETGDIYLLMEFVDGYDVCQWVRRRREEGRPLTLDEITIIAYRIAAALDYAHEEGVIHRDIKPSNVRVDFEGNVKVLDFGLAAHAQASVSPAGVADWGLAGTPSYMPPEQWEGREQGAATDQFALAATVCELMYGDPPFGKGDLNAVRQATLVGEPRLPDGQPAHVNDALRRALSKDPAQRFASCGAFVKALAGKGTEGQRPESGGQKTEVGDRKSETGGLKRVRLAGAAALAVLSVVVLGVLLHGLLSRSKTLENQPVEGKPYALDLGGGVTLEMAWIPRAEGFWLGRTEVSVDQWRKFVDATGYITDAENGGSTLCYDVKSGIVKSESGICWRNPGFAQAGDHPVVCVSWNDMKAFCRWVNSCNQSGGLLPSGFEYRLPGEAEWIFASKGGREGTKYWWGDTLAEGEGRINCAGAESLWTPHLPWNDGYVFTSPCGFYGAKGRNGYGLSDMVGNAWEICEDDYSPEVGPQETIFKANTKERVIRGCPAYDSVAEYDRGKAFFSRSYPTSGFRLCLGKIVGKSAEQKTTAKKRAPVVPEAKEWVSQTTGMEFVWIPTLKMWVGKYEVTNGEYRKKVPSHDSKDRNGESLNGDRQPVVRVNDKDGQAYADWLTERDRLRLDPGWFFRLPTETEWLTFAQCGGARKYPWGDSEIPTYGNYSRTSGYDDGFTVSCPVEKSGVNEWGLYGVGGNVMEYVVSATSNVSTGICKGAAFSLSGIPAQCRMKFIMKGEGRFNYAGFRLVLAP